MTLLSFGQPLGGIVQIAYTVKDIAQGGTRAASSIPRFRRSFFSTSRPSPAYVIDDIRRQLSRCASAPSKETCCQMIWPLTLTELQ